MWIRAILIMGAILAMTAATARAGTLENLERERAQTIRTLVAPDYALEERASRLEAARQRLVDLERMVLRDRSLRGQDTPVVRRAFANYDLTFLVHASIERERTLSDHWLRELGVSTDAVMSGRVGRR